MSQVRIPEHLAEAARTFVESDRQPATPRDAATVMLLRPATAGFEVYMLRRQPSMEFAPGACVFPGGSVDQRDADEEVAWTGPGVDHWGQVFDAPPELARALVCAAVRETFEESGVLLAGPEASPADLVRDGAGLAGDRRALLAGTASLGEVLTRRGLAVRADLLTPWARWITPEASPRRFDTWFFAAALPPGQTAIAAPEGDADPGESESGMWLRPAAALEAAEAGEITLLPPTAVTLGELAGHQDVAAILARRPVIAPRLPKVIVEDGQARLALPQTGPQTGPQSGPPSGGERA